MAGQHIGSWNVSALQQRVQVGRDLRGVLGGVSGLAPPATCAVVDADPGVTGDGRRDPPHVRGHLARAGLQHDGGTARAGAVQVQAVSADVDQLTRHRVGPGIRRRTHGRVAAAHRGKRQSPRSPGRAASVRLRLRSCRWARTTIQIANASRAGGHTQSSTSCTEEPNASSRRPPSPMNSAGAAAHRCGWSVNRTESTASIAQPSANPHRTAPVTALSSAGMNGAATRSRAASESGGQRAGHDPTDASPAGCRGGRISEVGVWSTREVAMAIIPSAGAKTMRRKSDRARQPPAAR